MSLLVADEASTILSDICEFVIDSEHRTAPTQDSGYPYIRTPNIGRGRIITENLRYVSEEAYIQWTRRGVPESGDLILAREAPVGNIAIVKGKMKPCLGQRTVLIRPNTKLVDPDFLTYFLLGDEVQSKFHGFSIGATVPHLNMSDIRGLKLPQLPRLHEQRIIGSILSAYDDLIENNHRRIQLLEEMARAIYREWFVLFGFPGHEEVEMVDSELGEIPEGWELRKLGDIAEEVRRNVKPSDLPSDTPYVGLAEIPRKSIALHEWGRAEAAGSSKLDFRTGAILFGKIRPYFHKVVVAPVDGICSGDAFVIVPRTPEMFALVLSVVNSDAFVAHATASSKGTKMPRADWAVLVKYPVVVPETRILERFNSLVEKAVELIHALILIDRSLRQTRNLLLPRLVSSQIDVSELDFVTLAGNYATSIYGEEQSTPNQWLDGDDDDV